MNKDNYHKKCLICNSDKINNLIGYEKHNLVKCNGCGFVFMKQIPTLTELTNYYGNYTYDRETILSPLTIKSYNLLLDEFEKFRKNNTILDVGCGLGFFLEVAKKRGWKVYGTEYSSKAVEICNSKNIEMKTGKLNLNDFDENCFDVITSFEVIEHINNPIEDLKLINKFLRKQGLFYCTTPNFNSIMRYYLKEKYHVICYPEHLSYYTKKTLNKVITNSNFSVYKFLSTGISISGIKSSTGNINIEQESQITSDEVLRQNIDKNWLLHIGKKFANYLFTLTNTGLTLKGYYIKK